LEKPTKPFAVFTKQFAVTHGLKLALGNGAHWEYSRTHDPAQSVELRRKQAIADGPFCSEEDAAVGKTDCTPMLKLVPFVDFTDARKHESPNCVGVVDMCTQNKSLARSGHALRCALA
jgi:hypothetical protein